MVPNPGGFGQRNIDDTPFGDFFIEIDEDDTKPESSSEKMRSCCLKREILFSEAFCIIVSLILLVTIFFYSETSVKFVFGPLATGLLIHHTIQHVLDRAEKFFSPSLYTKNKNNGKLSLEVAVNIIIFPSLAIFLWMLMRPDVSMVFSVVCVMLIWVNGKRLIAFQTLPAKERAYLAETEMIGVGRAAAYSYYFGYLRFIMTSDSLEPSFVNRIEKFEDLEGVKVLIKKLFIILPESCDVPNTLILEEDKPFLEHAKKLDPKKVTRAGVLEREFHNTVYKINGCNGKKPIFCVTEAATPLITLRNMTVNGPIKGLTEEQMHQEAKLFCKTLEEILDADRECGRNCVLVKIPDLQRNGVKISDYLKAAIDNERRKLHCYGDYDIV